MTTAAPLYFCAFCESRIFGGPGGWHSEDGREVCRAGSPTTFHEPKGKTLAPTVTAFNVGRVTAQLHGDRWQLTWKGWNADDRILLPCTYADALNIADQLNARLTQVDPAWEQYRAKRDEVTGWLKDQIHHFTDGGDEEPF